MTLISLDYDGCGDREWKRVLMLYSWNFISTTTPVQRVNCLSDVLYYPASELCGSVACACYYMKFLLRTILVLWCISSFAAGNYLLLYYMQSRQTRELFAFHILIKHRRTADRFISAKLSARNEAGNGYKNYV